jgi:dolichol kinase
MQLVLTIFTVFVLLCVSEVGWRRHWFNNEFGRKFVHVTVGSFVAFWPFFLTWSEIRLLSLAFFVAVIVSHQLKVFRAIHSVQRPTYGEVFFALTVGLLTLFTHSKAVYAAALLQMSLADGLAAIVGTRYGRDNKYRLFGHDKSVVGTAAFVVTSLVLLIGYNMFGPGGLSVAEIALITTGATLLENAAPLGLDNLVVPLYVCLLLTNL